MEGCKEFGVEDRHPLPGAQESANNLTRLTSSTGLDETQDHNPLTIQNPCPQGGGGDGQLYDGNRIPPRLREEPTRGPVETRGVVVVCLTSPLELVKGIDSTVDVVIRVFTNPQTQIGEI